VFNGSAVTTVNCWYLENSAPAVFGQHKNYSTQQTATSATTDQFKDGTVAEALGAEFEQGDNYPVFTIPAKEPATASFAKKSLCVHIDEEVPVNKFTTNSTAAVEYSSSEQNVATIDIITGEVTPVGIGTTIITAEVGEDEEYAGASATYLLRVIPENSGFETFDEAENVTLGGNSTYLTTPTQSFRPSASTGILWTTLLGSVRDNLGAGGEENISAVIRSKKEGEEEYAYLESDSISGGIDSLAFYWNSNGNESDNPNNWDIRIYINGDSVGAITDKPQAKQTAGNEFRYTLGGLQIDGKFVIKFVNRNDHSTAITTNNQMRWVIDNLEWYGYKKPEETGMEHVGANGGSWTKVIRNGQLILVRDGVKMNILGVRL